MSTKDLLFELGTEEIPAGFIRPALEVMERTIARALERERVDFAEVRTLGTPRRLVMAVTGLNDKQPEARVEVRGPKVEQAYDGDGKPTKALMGFAKGQGVTIDDIERVESGKGAHVVARKVVPGTDTVSILPGILSEVTGADLFPKTMRWGSGTIAFGRPVHWIVALYGGKVVELEFAGVKSGRTTRGHRFLCRKGALEVSGMEDYLDALKAASVIVDPVERHTIITDGIHRGASKAGGEVVPDDALIEEVVNLVEYPVVLTGSFDRDFLELPREVIVNAMRSHQRYFSVADADGALMPYFITVANIDATDHTVVIKGNERVLRARLNDAKFYFDQDRKTGMEDWVTGLKGVVFQARLGTSYEKVERFSALAMIIADRMGGNAVLLKRAAMLSKADLMSGMVMEFPKLQGIMGGIYAGLAGEDEEVSLAIREHYMPVAAGGELPSSALGAIVSIADKMDTIAGCCFGVGLIPTGAQDPYALRRAALGIISIILNRRRTLMLDDLIGSAVDGIGEKLTRDAGEVKQDVIAFFRERLKNQLLSQGLSFDAIDAVLATGWFDMVDAVSRIRALEVFKGDPECESLVIAFKRVSNILKGSESSGADPDPALFIDAREGELYGLRIEIAPKVEERWRAGDYAGVFSILTSLKGTIDAFFDEVMVMVDDENVRANRLYLLDSIRKLYSSTADLSKLTITE